MRISDWSSDVCSSDLVGRAALVARRQHVRPAAHRVIAVATRAGAGLDVGAEQLEALVRHRAFCPRGVTGPPRAPWRSARRRSARSEEHTSELQSLMRISYAVFCLKKKTQRLHTCKLTT